jgi:hypothetical protein
MSLGASSALLTSVQQRPDAPFGSLFLRVTLAQDADFPLDGKNSTSSNEETSMDGKSKLDPVYDDDNDEDRAEQDFLCSLVGAGTIADLLV